MQTSGRKVGRPRASETESSPLSAKNIEERRAFILETAARLFHANGYAGTSVGAIARELGVSKAMIHYYWGTKEELLEEIQERALLLLREKLARLEEQGPYGSWLEATVSAYIDAVFENRFFISVLVRDFASSERTRERRQVFMQECQRAVRADISDGKVREFDPQVLILALVGMFSTIANWYEPEGRMSREEIKETYMSLASRGFLPQPEQT